MLTLPAAFRSRLAHAFRIDTIVEDEIRLADAG